MESRHSSALPSAVGGGSSPPRGWSSAVVPYGATPRRRRGSSSSRRSRWIHVGGRDPSKRRRLRRRCPPGLHARAMARAGEHRRRRQLARVGRRRERRRLVDCGGQPAGVCDERHVRADGRREPLAPRTRPRARDGRARTDWLVARGLGLTLRMAEEASSTGRDGARLRAHLVTRRMGSRRAVWPVPPTRAPRSRAGSRRPERRTAVRRGCLLDRALCELTRLLRAARRSRPRSRAAERGRRNTSRP